MKIKLDENLPNRLATALTALGHDIDTVDAERLSGQIDPNVWSATQAAQRFFITQDLDFSDMRRYTPGTHAGLLLVRPRTTGPRGIVRARGHRIPNRERRGLAWMPRRHDRSKDPHQAAAPSEVILNRAPNRRMRVHVLTAAEVIETARSFRSTVRADERAASNRP